MSVINVLIVNAIFSNEDPIDVVRRETEIDNLVSSIDMFPFSSVEQTIDIINKRTYIGSGKLSEIKAAIDAFRNTIKAVVFNFDLSPLQYRNISEYLEIDIFDRTGIILEIFSRRAQTREAKLQVEIASLEYQKSHMVSKGANYSQDTSSGGGFTNTRGVGEKQIDLDRYRFRRYQLKKERELNEVVKQRKNERARRLKSCFPIASIVGYTNAGKSTLLNRLLEYTNVSTTKEVLEENRLFATLETTTRVISPNDFPTFLLTDTVGFIDNLPTSLVKAFRSTLEEIKEANLLIQVVDISDDDYTSAINVTNSVLKDIGVNSIPTIYLYNKFDLVDKTPFIPDKNSLFVSLNDLSDVNDILSLIYSVITKNWLDVDLFLPYEENLYGLKRVCYINSVSEEENGYRIRGRICPSSFDKYKKYII